MTLWLSDLRWALNAMRARRFRRGLLFSQRQAFDAALRHPLEPNVVVAYPDAFYHATIDDLCRAIVESQAHEQLTTEEGK